VPAKATEGGDFYCFALEIFEYATGSVDQYERLEPWIKKLVRPFRQDDALTREIEALLCELEKLPKRDDESTLKRCVELSRAIRDRQNKKLRLTQLTWPHYWPQVLSLNLIEGK
jgi:hypothetical protein